MHRFIVLAIMGVFGTVLFLGCKSKRTVTGNGNTKQGAKVVKTKKSSKRYTGDGRDDLPPDTGVFQVVKVNSPEEYIAIFSDIARYEMEIYGIPASITLAQGLLESGFGRGELTLKTNNHFGIKCHTGWEGDYDLYDDDEKGECFRKYNHPRYSYRDHSIFLATRPRYAFLFNLPLNGYKRWAHGLRKAGYATDRKYPQKLISLIERYELYKYDRGVVVNAELPLLEGPLTDEVHIVQRGDTLYALSRRYNVAVDDIRIVNRIQGDTISVGQKLTIPSKRTN